MTPTWRTTCCSCAESDDLGDLKALRLGEATLPDLPTLGRRLRRYIQLLDGRPLRVRLVADDRLRYEPAAQIIATCSAAGVSAIRLSPPVRHARAAGGGFLAVRGKSSGARQTLRMPMDRLSRLVAIIALACLWLSAQSGLVRADEPDPARDDQ